jgi:hypothetical protein
MHFSTLAAALCLSLSICAAVSSAQSTVVPGTAAPGAAAPASPAGSSSGDAAAKHAKRTACLKEAKTRKLVGADKTAFLKNCIAAP